MSAVASLRVGGHPFSSRPRSAACAAIGRSANGAAAVQRPVIMGGTVHVAGNLHEAGENENVMTAPPGEDS